MSSSRRQSTSSLASNKKVNSTSTKNKELKLKLSAKQKSHQKLVEQFRQLISNLRKHHSTKRKELTKSQKELQELKSELLQCQMVKGNHQDEDELHRLKTSIRSQNKDVKSLLNEVETIAQHVDVLEGQHNHYGAISEETDLMIQELLNLEEEDLEEE
jgi:hypothetical protein